MADNASPDLGGIISLLMQNPEAISGIMSVLKNSGIRLDKPEKTEFTEKGAESAEAFSPACDPPPNRPGCGDDFRRENCPPPPGKDDGRRSPCGDPGCPPRGGDCRPPKDEPCCPPPPPPPPPKKKPGAKERDQLLCALKPYLSPERCETLDEILRLAELFELFRKKGGKH